MACPNARRVARVAVFVLLLLASSAPLRGQGLIVVGVGPVNRGMGSAGTAAPLEAIGALHWNPASISALPRSEMSFGLEGLLADVDLEVDSVAGSAKTSGEPGVAIIPSVGWVHHLEGTRATIGLGIYGIAGFRNNMPADPANPLLAAGPIYADAEFYQIAPTLSIALSERTSIGIAPTVTAARITLDPLGPSVVTPVPTPGSGNRIHWGGGVQAGIYHILGNGWHLGFSIKSPQWMEDFRFFTPGGVVTLDLDYPMILSLGAAYSGLENWVLACDIRYIDFKNSDGLDALGWSNVFGMGVGVQYQINECWRLRAGYAYNQNPLHAGDAFANLATPLIQQHNLSFGLSYRLADAVDVSLAYVWLINSRLTGPLPSPPFAPGDTLTHEIEAHSALLGVTVRY